MIVKIEVFFVTPHMNSPADFGLEIVFVVVLDVLVQIFQDLPWLLSDAFESLFDLFSHKLGGLVLELHLFLEDEILALDDHLGSQVLQLILLVLNLLLVIFGSTRLLSLLFLLQLSFEIL